MIGLGKTSFFLSTGLHWAGRRPVAEALSRRDNPAGFGGRRTVVAASVHYRQLAVGSLSHQRPLLSGGNVLSGSLVTQMLLGHCQRTFQHKFGQR